MNTAYRIVWNTVTGNWVVASELAKGRKKGGSKRAVVGAVLVAGVLGSLSMSHAAFAADGGALVVCGQDGTVAHYGTGGPNTTGSCASTTYDWGLFSGANPDGSAGGVNQTSLTGNSDGTMSIYAVNGVKMLSTMDMGNYKITGLANGTAATDAATFGQLTNATKYFVTNSTLPNSIVYAADAVAIGGGAQAGNPGYGAYTGSVAVGVNANGGGGRSVAVGSGATTGQAPGINTLEPNTYDLVAIGDNAAAYYGHSIAMGGNALVNPAPNGTNGFGYAIGIGDGVSVTQVGGTALGATAQVTGQYATALGFGSNASATNAIAVGNASNASAANAIAVGNTSTASGAGGVAVGNTSTVSGAGGVAVGNTAHANGAGDVAIGQGATAMNTAGLGGNPANSAVAIGYDAAATSMLSMAVGNQATANSPFSGSFGLSAKSSAIGAEALGSFTSASGSYALALGYSANASAGNSVALGSYSTTTANLGSAAYNPGSATLAGTASAASGEVSIGTSGNERRLTNLAAGSAATDAVNVSQLQAEDATVDLMGANTAAALGGGSTYNATTGAITAPSYTLANANSIGGTSGAATDVGTGFAKVDGALGKLNTAVATNTTNIAGNTTAISNISNQINNGTVGLVQQAAAGAHLTVGRGTDGAAVDFADVNGNTRTLKSVTAGVADTDAVNMSQLNATNANVTQNTSDIAGNTTSINALNTNVAQNTANIAGNTTSINNLTTRVTTNEGDISTINTTISGMNGQLADAVMYDSSAHDKVTLGNAGTPVQVTNVKNGDLSSASTDAVNGSQLYATNQQVAQNASDIAGNTTAIAGNTTSINNISNQINNGTVGLLQQAAAGANLTVGKGTDGTAVDFADMNGNTRTLKNVTAGVADTDAVNMSQLNATNANVTQNTSDIAGNTMSINTLNTNVAQNTTDIAGSTTSINNLTTRVTTNEDDISTINTTIAGMNGQLADAVMYDSATHDKVTLGTAGTPVQLTNVKNGDLSAASADAVNGSQLYTTNQQVAQNTTDIAGNTTSINSLQNTVNNINSGTVGLVQQASAGADLTVGKDTDGAAVDFADKNGNTRTLKNVTAGVANTDAVNMSQLNATDANVAQNTSDIAGNTTAISNIDARVTQNTGNISTLNTSVSNIDARVTQNTSDIAGNTASISNITNEINNGTVGLVQQAAAGANLTVGKDTDGTAVDFAGTAGARKLVNVADGAVADGSKEAVNGGQLHGVSQSVANAMGGGSTVNSDGSISAPSYTVTNVDGSTSTVNNVGDAITNIDNRTYSNTTAISDLSQTVNNIISNGAGIKYFHTNSTQADSVASGANAVAVGGNSKASASSAVAVGSGAQATQANSVALGSGSATSAVMATSGATIAGTSYTYAGAAPTGTVSVGSAGSERTVTNVAAGQVSATSTDAVNGSQLYATNQAVNQLDGRMGNVENNLSNVTSTVNNISNTMANGQSGMFQVSADSNGTQPVASGTRSTAGGNGAAASGNSSTAVGNGAQATGSNSVAIGADSVASRDNTVSVGSAGKERQVTNVAAGTADTDAVNVSQLKSAGVINSDGSANQTVTYDHNTDGSTSVTLNSSGDPTIIHNVAAGQVSSDAATVGQVNDAMQQTANWAKNYTDQQVANVSRQARAGSASAIAVASLPQAYQPGQNSAGVAFGTYQGQNAVSVGMSAISGNGRYIVKFSATGSQHSGAGAGIGAGMVW